MGSIVSSMTASAPTATSRTAKSLADFAEHLFIDGGNVLKVSHSKRVDEPAKFFSWAFRIENRGWLFVSDGLIRFGLASEVIFGLETNDNKPAIGAFSFLEALYRAAVTERLDLRDGGLASVDLSTLCSQQNPSIGFVSSLLVRISLAQLDQHILFRSSLSPGAQNTIASLISTERSAFLLVPLTATELTAYNTGGSTRVLSALALKDTACLASWPPLPVFIKPNRSESLVSTIAIESVLKETVQADLRGSISVLESTSVTGAPPKRRVVLRLRREHTSLLQSLFSELPIESAFVIMTKTDPLADSCLAWSPERPYRRASIIHALNPASDASGLTKIAGSFVAFLTDQPQDDTIVFEDGFFVRMTVSTWKQVRASLADGSNVTVPTTSSTFFPLSQMKEYSDFDGIESFFCEFEPSSASAATTIPTETTTT